MFLVVLTSPHKLLIQTNVGFSRASLKQTPRGFNWENTLSMTLNWFFTQGKFFLGLFSSVVSLVLLLNLEKGVLNSTKTKTVLSMKECASPTSTARHAPPWSISKCSPKFRCARRNSGSCVWIFCPLRFHSSRHPMFDWHLEFCPQVPVTSLYLYNTWHVDREGFLSWKKLSCCAFC